MRKGYVKKQVENKTWSKKDALQQQKMATRCSTVKRKNANTASFVDKRHPIILQHLYVKVSKSKNTTRREKMQVIISTYR